MEEGINHGDQTLREAIEESYPLYLLSKTRHWDANTTKIKEASRLNAAQFIVEHFEHGGFGVVSEYKRDVVVIDIRPQAPEYQALDMKDAVRQALEAEKRLHGCLMRAQA